jgi:hypothetical protein
MQPFVRFLKLFIGFFLMVIGVYVGWWSNLTTNSAGLICFVLVAIGLFILWQEWRDTRG